MTEKTAVQRVTSDGGPTNFYSLRRKLPEPQAIFSFTDFCSNAADSGGNVPIMSNTVTRLRISYDPYRLSAAMTITPKNKAIPTHATTIRIYFLILLSSSGFAVPITSRNTLRSSFMGHLKNIYQEYWVIPFSLQYIS
jgi:hypothetical protein